MHTRIFVVLFIFSVLLECVSGCVFLDEDLQLIDGNKLSWNDTLAMRRNALLEMYPHLSKNEEALMRNVMLCAGPFNSEFVSANRPDIVLVDHSKNTTYIVDVIIPHDENLQKAERDKILKYMDLAHEIKDMWRTPATIVVPIVISTNGLIPKSLHANLCKVGVDGGLKYLMQKAVLLSTCRTLRRATWDHKTQGADWPASIPECAGDMQSPINIVTTDAVKVAFPPLVFKNYTDNHPNMTIINNGHTVSIQGPWGLNGTDDPIMYGGPLQGTYRLYGVHFHWGYDETAGAEHIIDGASGALEMHFVHYSTNYETIADAVFADDPESLAVVGYIFKPYWSTSVPARGFFNTLRTAVLSQPIFPAHFPLSMIRLGTQYFTYQGSLTVPPCSERVKWIVMRNPLYVSSTNLLSFRRWFSNGAPIQGNYRIPQPLNERTVVRN